MPLYIDRSEVETIIGATFPGYTGKKVQVESSESVLVHSLNWTGGSRNEYAACSMQGVPTGNASAGNAAPPWRNPVEGQSVSVPQGFALVKHCMFCGKDLGLTIYVNPADMPRYLQASNVELTDDEKTMLVITKGIISSYRREEASKKGINASQYAAIVEALKTKGMMSKNGALTLIGKNAATTLRGY